MNALLVLHPHCPLAPHQPFQNRTIPLAFRRGVGSLLPLHRPSPFLQPLKRTLITCLACPSRCIDPLHFYNLLKSTSTASPRTTTLASLVKGEVLSPEKIRATTGGIVTPPFLAPHQPSQNRAIPLAFRRASVCVCLVGFASIAIVVVCGRCVLHRLFATTCKHPCLKPLGTHA